MKRAEVILWGGRQHLKVAGLVVCTEGDLCRAAGLPAKWTPAMLRRVRDLINDEAGESEESDEEAWARDEVEAGRCPASPDSMHGPFDSDGRCGGCAALVGPEREPEWDRDGDEPEEPLP